MDDLESLRLELKAVSNEIRELEAESKPELDGSKTDLELERDLYVTMNLIALRWKEDELFRRLTQIQSSMDSAGPQAGGTQLTSMGPSASDAGGPARHRRLVRVSVPATTLERLDSMARRVGVERNALIQMAVFQALGAEVN